MASSPWRNSAPGRRLLQLLWLPLLPLLAIPALAPLITEGLPRSYDGGYHLLRLAVLDRAVASGTVAGDVGVVEVVVLDVVGGAGAAAPMQAPRVVRVNGPELPVNRSLQLTLSGAGAKNRVEAKGSAGVPSHVVPSDTTRPVGH